MHSLQYSGSTSEVLDLGDGVVVKQPRKVWEGNAKRKTLEEEYARALDIERKIIEWLGSYPRIVPYLGPHEPSGIRLARANHGNLQEYIDRHDHEIGTPQRWTWVLQAAESVGFLHCKAVIHSDLRPENWLVNSQWQLWLYDFGGSTCEKLGLDGGHLPDDPFFDPRLPDESTPAVDIFSLGSTFYTIMTGHWPFLTGPPPTNMEKFEFMEKASALFAAGQFPDVSDIPAGIVIRGCWDHTYDTAAEVVRAVKDEMEIVNT
ncbi:kinase [Hypoxylon sp. FL1284]|nr:kinase [Hypoxylon sp. FL1284]